MPNLRFLLFSIFSKKFMFIIRFLLIIFLIYASFCTFLYFAQENLIFHPQKLANDFNFAKLFPNSQEINLKSTDNINLNALFFKSSKTSITNSNINLIKNTNTTINTNLQTLADFPTNLANNSLKKSLKKFLNNSPNKPVNILPNPQNSANFQFSQNQENSKKDSKGLIFYLHGNSGSVTGWGNVAKFYNELCFDVLMSDYRGFGKSEGKITSQEQLFVDNQLFYDFAKSIYPENKITVMGFSIGTGMAAKIAQRNLPKQLILQAPYYSLHQVMIDNFVFVPEFLLKYKLETAQYLENSTLPITIFHGTLDETISYSNSVKIEAKFNKNPKKQTKSQDQTPAKIRLITLPNQDHTGIEQNEIYKKEIKQILE